MRVEQLEYIRVVTRLGSLRRAAGTLHLSQPALSDAVRTLERELGVEVLERRPSGVRISAAGRELLPYMPSGPIDPRDGGRANGSARRAGERQLHASPASLASLASPVPASGPVPDRLNHGNAPSS